VPHYYQKFYIVSRNFINGDKRTNPSQGPLLLHKVPITLKKNYLRGRWPPGSIETSEKYEVLIQWVTLFVILAMCRSSTFK
jgi:hypothetical protein